MNNNPQTKPAPKPQVVLIYDNKPRVIETMKILKAQIKNYQAIPMDKQTSNILINSKPKVILFALSQPNKSVEYYAKLVESDQINYSHLSVILCGLKESVVAFQCCMKGLFDDYFIYDPIIDKCRLLMIVHYGLMLYQSKVKLAEFNNENFVNLDKELTQLIDHSSQCKHQLIQKVALSKEQVVKNTQVNADQGQLPVDPVDPVFNQLESDIKIGLDSIIDQLHVQKSNQQQHAKKVQEYNNWPDIKSKLMEIQNDIHKTKDIYDNATQRASPTAQVKASAELKKILVVEDNVLYRELLGSVLKKENFEIDEARDGIYALEKIANEHFDLIIMDLFMPNLDGLNTTKKIRQLSGGCDIPVIALTGNKNKEVVKQWAHHGLKGYIVKPSTSEEILSMVNKVLNPMVSRVQ